MSERIHIKSGEHGVVRLFAVDLPAEEIAAFTRRNGTWPLRDSLGAERLDPDKVEVFDVADLSGVGLAGYLEEGMGIAPEQIAPMRAQIDALRGAVLVLPSSAFGGTEQTLAPRAPLRLVARFSEEREPVSFDPLPDESAQPTAPAPPARPEPKAASDAAMSGRVAMIALLVLAVLVAVMVWIA